MLKYDLGTGEYKNWLVSEVEFNANNLGKAEAIMSLGNGYLGLRSSFEEQYLGEVRNLFVAGTFNQFDEFEVTELPNAADVVQLNILINGERFSLEKGTIKSYNRTLNLKTGELTRYINWENNRGQEFELIFRRFVSLNNLHLIGMRVEIKPLNSEAEIVIGTGINAQVTNTGAQHFHEGVKRIYDKKYIQLLQQTTESKIDFVLNTVHSFSVDGKELEISPRMKIDRRKVLIEGSVNLNKGQHFIFEKISNIYTSRDKEYDNANYNLETLRDDALANLKLDATKGYEALLNESIAEWSKIWGEMEISIDGKNEFDQLAIRFAQYHLIVMTPAHDNRFGIGAKALSGEGYKGHSFWDTEIFILPYFIYTFPNIARSLLEYRFNNLQGARKKAIDNGYEGAMYPWESAFTGEEVTPVWGGVDIVTGKATKIWSGFIEQHITSDIAFAVWQYYMVTNDQDFMDKRGYEILFDTATFWQSRLEWNEEYQRYHINNVIGPDEYKEHVNNNAFTNHMAHWNIMKAIEYYNELKNNRAELWAELSQKLNLEEKYSKWTDKVDKIYLPSPREEDLVIPQDDTYLSKKIIDLTKYKNQTHVGSMFEDYNLEQVNQIQVSKQADIMVLFYLLENRFTKDVKRANWNYYEPKTLHDSSLSLSTHSVLASDMEDSALAYDLFRQAANIDLGPNMKSSDHGIHSASIGGIWQAVVNGFGGVRMLGGKLRISPKLPKEWEQLRFPITWKNNKLDVTVKKNSVSIKNATDLKDQIEIEIHGKQYVLEEELEVTF